MQENASEKGPSGRNPFRSKSQGVDSLRENRAFSRKRRSERLGAVSVQGNAKHVKCAASSARTSASLGMKKQERC